MQNKFKPHHLYFVINVDEPYAIDIYELLKKGQMQKGDWPEGDISFIEWIYQNSLNFQDAYSIIRKIVTTEPIVIKNIESLSSLIFKLRDENIVYDADEFTKLYNWIVENKLR